MPGCCRKYRICRHIRIDTTAKCRLAANNKVVEQTASFASSKKKSTVSKEETVYATLDANGGVTDVIVSDWLKNSGQVDSVKDSSTLKDITNTKGDEKFTQSGDSLTWDTSKSDIYYQGTAENSRASGWYADHVQTGWRGSISKRYRWQER